MKLLSYNGTAFPVTPKFPDPSTPGPDRMPEYTPRLGADPMPGGVTVGTQTLSVQFTPGVEQATEATLMAVLAILALDDPYPKTLIAQLAGGDYLHGDATVGNYRYVGQNTLAVDFTLYGPWRDDALTTLRAASTFTGSVTVANTANTGNTDLLPTLTVYWDGSQRTSSTSDLGWKHRLGTGLTLTNTGSEPITNQPYQIGPINHKALVTAGQAKSNGDDFRVWCEGVELRRNLIAANTVAMFAWVILPTIAPGQSITLDLLTNNPSAGSPPTLTFNSEPPLPGMDISGTTATLTSYTHPTMTFSGVSWETNQWAGGTVVVIQSGGGAWDQARRIVSNTATTITLDRSITNADSTDTFVILKSGFVGTGGTISAGSTSSRVDDTPAVARVNEYVGATLEIVTGTLAGQKRTITSNTTNAFTVSPAFSSAPTSPNAYRIYRTNGNRMWDVRQPPKTTNYPGLWQANKIQAPPTQVRFDAPGSWYRFTYQPNRDTYSQPRYDSFLVGAGDYDHVPIMNIQRARSGKQGTQREVGIADAIGVSSPFPINGIWFGYTLRNAKKAGVAEGMCEARFMTQEAGGELWSAFLSDVAVRNSTATITPAWYDLTGYGTPNRIAMTLIPNGGDEIPSADSNTAQLRSTGDYVSLSVNPQSVLTESVDWFASPPSAVAVYDVHLIAMVGPLSSPIPPYPQLEIGGPDHRIAISATDERIVVDCETKAVYLTNDAGTYLRPIPWVVQPQTVISDADDTERTVVAARWLPIPPASTTPIGGYLQVDDQAGAGSGSLGLAVSGRTGFRV